MKKNNERLNRAATIASKITEVGHWVAVGLLAAGLVAYFTDKSLLRYLMDLGNGEFAVVGYSIDVLDAGGNLLAGAFVPALIIGIVVCGLMAMVFRNIYLIFKTSAGQTKFSKGATPFQPENVRMLREIGIFVLSIAVVEFAVDNVARLAAGAEVIESSISASGLVFGIAMLCLSQFFAYGTQLQSDADGLL